MSPIEITSPPSRRPLLNYLIAACAGLIIFYYAAIRLFVAVDPGFVLNSNTGEIISVSGEPASGLQPGDRLIQAGSVSFADFAADPHQPLLPGYRPGDTVTLVVERDGRQLTLDHPITDFSPSLLANRLLQMVIPIAFWVAGTAALLLLRPRGPRWRLMVAFFFLTGLWIAAGQASGTHYSSSKEVLRSAIWMCVPIYLHLHWRFPQPLGRLPGWVFITVYGLSAVAAAAEWLDLLPRSAYFAGLLLAISGSIILISLHAILRPAERRDLTLLAAAVFLILLPVIIFSVVSLLGNYPNFSGVTQISMLLLPGAYFYTVYHRQLGGLELRANRTITTLIFIMLLFLGLEVFVAVAHLRLNNPSAHMVIGLTAGLTAALATLLVYPTFARWIERHVLGMPLPPTKLLETYSGRIVTSLELEGLVHLLRDEVLPSLLVRQAALLRTYECGDGTVKLAPVFSLGIDAADLPDLPTGLPSVPWVRLAFPLTVNRREIGTFLLGRRDPDDLYAASEMPVLKVLIDQTAMALVNIEQAERLRLLSQVTLERQDTERLHLALELHDDVLGQMASLRMNVSSTEVNAEFLAAYAAAVERIRQIIAGLYPGMLAAYGLPPALEELADTLSAARSIDPMGAPEIEVDLDGGVQRYPPGVELQLFRIVQQAAANALQHAHPRHIRIGGRLEAASARLEIADDGCGFDFSNSSDLGAMLAQRHFGLAGMYERAAFIGATVEIASKLGEGTKVSVRWAAK